MTPYSVYFHLPFCRSRCIYCDFVSNTVSPLPVEATTAQMLRELEARRSWSGYSDTPISVYIGGGTPSLWPAPHLARLVHAAVQNIPHNIEITVEMNPGDGDERWIEELVAAGVNRFSVGAQAMNDERLQWLGRRHTQMDTIRTVGQLRKLGVSNISVDFIYATPGQTVQSITEELAALETLNVAHISAYELTVAHGTRLARMNPDILPDDTREQFWRHIYGMLFKMGFELYEVSNYAKPGFQSVHNKHYWDGGVYLGIGSGAHGFAVINGQRIRYSNGPTLSCWQQTHIDEAAIGHHPGLGDGYDEQLSDIDFARELVMLGLRRVDGIDERQLFSAVGRLEEFRKPLEELIAQNLLQHRSPRLIPTQEAMLLADELALRFF